MTWLKRITPILIVDAIEPCLPFWEATGFAITSDVRSEGHRGHYTFVTLEKSGLEVMYQTRASVREDLPPLANAVSGNTVLYLEVMQLDDIIAELAGAPVVIPRRRTFYGTEEIGYREPGGNTVIFCMAVSD